jgi:hypothetical protein
MEDTPISYVFFEIIGTMSGTAGYKYRYYRILTQSSRVKYLAFMSLDLMILDIHGERLDFNTVPEGDWNIGYLIPKRGSDKLTLDTVEKRALFGVSSTWCPNFIDYLALNEPCSSASELQGQHQMQSILCREHLGLENVVVNFEWYPYEIYGPVRETKIYALIEGYNIGPKFLAHVTENRDRVIGYMVEHVPARSATSADLELCREVLRMLHKLGITHGNINPAAFLIHNGRALLHGFASARQTQDRAILNAEMDSLENVLRCDWEPVKHLWWERGNQRRTASTLQTFQIGMIDTSEEMLKEM